MFNSNRNSSSLAPPKTMALTYTTPASSLSYLQPFHARRHFKFQLQNNMIAAKLIFYAIWQHMCRILDLLGPLRQSFQNVGPTGILVQPSFQNLGLSGTLATQFFQNVGLAETRLRQSVQDFGPSSTTGWTWARLPQKINIEVLAKPIQARGW